MANKKKSDLISEIIFRVVAALLSLTAIPAAIGLPVIKFAAGTSLLEYGLGEEMSILELSKYIDFDDMKKLLTSGDGISEAVKPLITPLVCFVVFYVLAMVMSIVIFFFAVFSNMKKTILFESLGAILLVAASVVSFNKAAALILDGTVTLKDILGGGILSGIVSLFVEINTLTLSSAPFIMIASFITVAVWAVAFVMTEIGEKK